MEENNAWKIVLAGAFFSLVMLGIAYFLIAPRETSYFSDQNIEKLAEFGNVRIAGRKEGKKIWEFYARDGWSGKNQNITYLNNVDRGIIYKDGKPLVKNLSAPLVKVYRHSDIIEAFSSPHQPLKLMIDLGKVAKRKKEKAKWAYISANTLRYSAKEKTSEITGVVKLIESNSIIRADELKIDNEKKSALLSGKVEVVRKNSKIFAERLEYFGENEESKLFGKVRIDISEKKKKTAIKCETAVVSRVIDKDFFLSGGIEVVQRKKMAVAESGIYSNQLKILSLKGKTRTVFEKALALLNDDTANKLKNPDIKQILKNKTVIKADSINFSTQSGNAAASGSVEVFQKGHEAKSETALYDDSRELLILTGNVYMKKGSNWIACQKVTISISQETFNAIQVTEAKFKI